MPFGEYENFEDCVAKNRNNPDVEDPEAFCAALKQKLEADALRDRRISFDATKLEDKILTDDEETISIPAVIASEIVHQYDDGWAYKPADELEKMAKIAKDIGSVPIKILDHPTEDTNYLLVRQRDVHGRAQNFQFVKNLIDPKTQRPMRKGVRADLVWFKDRVPSAVIEKMRSGSLRDVSIGFCFDYDGTSGTFGGIHYDYIQRNIFLDHVAAPIEGGRCPGPVCGIGYDSSMVIKLDAALLNQCPVCRRIKDVGFALAGKRLWQQYGVNVLEVIEGNPIAVAKAQPTASLDIQFNKEFGELSNRLQLRKKLP